MFVCCTVERHEHVVFWQIVALIFLLDKIIQYLFRTNLVMHTHSTPSHTTSPSHSYWRYKKVSLIRPCQHYCMMNVSKRVCEKGSKILRLYIHKQRSQFQHTNNKTKQTLSHTHTPDETTKKLYILIHDWVWWKKGTRKKDKKKQTK